MDADSLSFLNKALESLAGAESEFAGGRYNNCANRCYYAMFQAAIAALMAAGVHATDGWAHDSVQAKFSGILIARRKLYPADLASLLPRVLDARIAADYETTPISRAVAERALQKARVLVGAVRGRLL